MSSPRYILTLACTDRPGIVGAVGTLLAEAGCNIVESAQFGDVDTGRFFMRVVFEPVRPDVDARAVEGAFAAVASRFGMEWKLHDAHARPRVLILVSKQDHCLNDLLYRAKVGALPMTVAAIVSNHPDTQPLADAYGIAFHHLPVTHTTKPAQEAALAALIDEAHVELVVLARYMQVLSDDLARHLAGRAINIHHGLLPSFKGARPYHQAYDRGVKLIGATAHYVTSDLDEGPIIEQEVARVDYNMRVDDLVALGRDVECVALARAVRFHLEQRVFLNGGKTVVFR
ncbi:MAG: formyltetrahydrofolate deformylase [Betaproteobacteria bacterium]|nr:formyltetrahydrofolate deformylase [Betaproteobacteria bacterium]